MGTTVRPAIQLKDFDKEIARLAKTFDDRELSKGFTQKAGMILLDSVKESFNNEAGADGSAWKSSAKKTKLGGRFAAGYNTRPSGAPVSSSSKRLKDTGVFQRSWTIIQTAYNKVQVAPFGERNLNIALAAKEKWHNVIGGIGKKQQEAIKALMEKYLREKAVQ